MFLVVGLMDAIGIIGAMLRAFSHFLRASSVLMSKPQRAESAKGSGVVAVPHQSAVCHGLEYPEYTFGCTTSIDFLSVWEVFFQGYDRFVLRPGADASVFLTPYIRHDMVASARKDIPPSGDARCHGICGHRAIEPLGGRIVPTVLNSDRSERD